MFKINVLVDNQYCVEGNLYTNNVISICGTDESVICVTRIKRRLTIITLNKVSLKMVKLIRIIFVKFVVRLIFVNYLVRVLEDKLKIF